MGLGVGVQWVHVECGARWGVLRFKAGGGLDVAGGLEGGEGRLVRAQQ